MLKSEVSSRAFLQKETIDAEDRSKRIQHILGNVLETGE